MIRLRKIVGNRYIISDNCDGLGGILRGKYVDKYADVSCVSFHAAHIISMGEGGMVLSDNQDILDRKHEPEDYFDGQGHHSPEEEAHHAVADES